jgi:hypothetical protein
MPKISDGCQKTWTWRNSDVRLANDYTYARTRARKPWDSRNAERGYEVAIHFVKEIVARRKIKEPDAEELFREQSERWKRETAHISSVNKMVTHPSYLRIIGMGREALPLILSELRERPDHWLVALNAITGEDPASEGANFHEAVKAWIRWGESKGYC